jgi:O-antigen ligase
VTAGRSAAATGAAATAFLLPVLYSPSVDAPFWSPKAALLLVTGAAGLALLPSLRRTVLRLPAAAAAIFLAVASLSTLLSDAPGMSITGLYNWGTGLLFLAACVGAWVCGALVPADDRRTVTSALLAGIVVSILVGVAQALEAVPVSSLEARGRVFGLAGNPVHLGSLAAVLVAVAAHRCRSALPWAAAAAGGAFAIQLSGTRLALLLLAPIAVAGAVRGGRRAGAVLVLAIALGVIGGNAFGELNDITTSAGRAASEGGVSIASGGGSKVRLQVWAYARHAIAREPLLGSGPGRFRAATSADRTLAVARHEGGDSIYEDAHNLVVEHLVTTGALGALALVAWLGLCFWRARGELAWVGATLLLMALAQPMSVGTTPLMFLCLGAAASTTATRPHRARAVGGALVGAAMATMLLVGDASLQQARLDFDLADARRARSLLGPLPQPASRTAVIWAERGLSDEEAVDTAVEWRGRAIERDPSDPALRLRLGDTLQGARDVAAARRAYLEALRLNPWSTSALTQLALLAEAEGDRADAVRYARRGLRVRPSRTLQRIVDAKQPGP